MVATAAGVIGALAAAAGAGTSIMGLGANNRQQQLQANLAQQQLALARQNQQNQALVQAMVNQRAVAGTQDAFGTTVRYDPTTNTWQQQLGPLPQAADVAAMNANIIRNTTDLGQQELANQVAMQRAAQAGPAANAAQLNLQNFRPMTADTLTSLLTQQGIEAARQAYDPLRADTLRAVARTGTAAGPVLRQLGLGEAQNLRNTLTDAQIQGLTNVAGINNANYQRLANAASTNAALATPQLGQQNLGTSAADQLIQQLTANRAQWAPSSTSQGMFGANQATGVGQGATGAAMGAVPNQNFGLTQSQDALKGLSANLSNPQTVSALGNLYNTIFGGGSNANVSGLDPSQGSVYTGQNPQGQAMYQSYAPSSSAQTWTPDSSQYNW